MPPHPPTDHVVQYLIKVNISHLWMFSFQPVGLLNHGMLLSCEHALGSRCSVNSMRTSCEACVGESSTYLCVCTEGRQTWCGPRRSTEKALRCLRRSSRILSSSESGSRGLLYSSSSTSFSEASPPGPAWLTCVELGSEALFFLHLVRLF